MRREYRIRLRIPRASAQFALLAALLAWPGSVLCPVQQTASVVGYVADESRPGVAVALTTNQTTTLGSDANAVITMVPQNCYPSKNTKLYGCTGATFNPAQCSEELAESERLFMPASGGTAYNFGVAGEAGTQGSPTCFTPGTPASTNPLRRVYLPAGEELAVGSRSDPDIFRFDSDIRVDRLCLWGTCSTFWPLEFSSCSIGNGSDSCASQQSCVSGTPPTCATSGTRNALQTINFDWTIPGSTVPVPPIPQTDGTVFNPWTFRHGIVGLFTTSCSGTPDQAVGTCGLMNPSGVGCEFPYHLADGKRNASPPAPLPIYPPDDSTNRLRRTDSVNTGNGIVTVTMNCYVIYPANQPSQTKGHCTITIPVQFTAQSCAKYRFLPSVTCTERFPTTDPNYVSCPEVLVSG